MDKRLPLEKQFIFICGLMGLSIKTFEDEIQERGGGDGCERDLTGQV